MNRQSRDKFASGTNIDTTSGNACWETAPAVFRKINADFGPFDIDLTADSQRHLLPVWFGPDSPVNECDALIADWLRYGFSGYSNPPYGQFVKRMLLKAMNESRAGFTSVLLLPLRVTIAFRKYILHGASELLFCDRRVIFWENGSPRLNPKTGKPDSALFDSIVVVYRPHTEVLRVGEWQVPTIEEMSHA